MPDKEERIKRRREIIQKRCSEKVTKGDQINKEVTANDCESVGKPLDHEHLKSEQQIAESVSQLRRRKENHIQDVSSTRIKVNHEESSRRIQHEHKRSEIIEKAKAGQKLNAEDVLIEIDWDTLDQDAIDLKEIHDTMKKIKSNYDEILAEKDSLIDDFREELKQQDQLYLDGLRSQERTIDHTREMTTKQISAIKAFGDDELKAIDEAFEEDRRILINEQSAHLKSLGDKKRSAVKESLQTVDTRKDDNEKDILNAHDAVNAEYNTLRNKLQDQVAQLEREWSVSRGLYLVSTDQIEYDHREIETRNSESELKIKRSKKRIVQFKEELNRELDRTRSTEEKEGKKNNSLELDCRRLEGQYQNLLSKLHRFEVSEDQKYFSALSMHKEEATMLLNRIRNVRDQMMELFAVHAHDAGSEESDEREIGTIRTNIGKDEAPTNGEEKTGLEIDPEEGSQQQTFSWSQLESVIVKYHELLEKRTSTLHNVSQVSIQNATLQSDLDASLKDDINKALIVPPLSY